MFLLICRIFCQSACILHVQASRVVLRYSDLHACYCPCHPELVLFLDQPCCCACSSHSLNNNHSNYYTVVWICQFQHAKGNFSYECRVCPNPKLETKNICLIEIIYCFKNVLKRQNTLIELHR